MAYGVDGFKIETVNATVGRYLLWPQPLRGEHEESHRPLGVERELGIAS